ncbi:DUF4760 domain-containing protein [uncultured Tateyamaria sp.]|uniref:DUF4760 domain-containing protein n=1 Tax=uncultured Tateyamaria sp. TaxID=455651 RepID=UPI002621488A|nr:DUF4760 domain-containing protein [uncultured Tateyamaria sp.]
MSECQEFAEAALVICAASNSFWWVSPLVIALSACAAAIISITSIRSNKEIARKRATLDLIERSETTEHYQSLYKAFTDVRKDDGGFEQLKSVTNPQLLEQRRKVIAYLNHYELMAIGIRKGILDEGVYGDFMRSTVVRDWHAAADFVTHIRTPTPDSGTEVPANKAFSEFETLAAKWEAQIRREQKGALRGPNKAT